eukprot:TRINITY_DN28607_c1_g1_i1.p1 TRINITY_DN28607_c1_g1~~TRINITY_DN28607_c1_g1_i1.p1  ORF type:complete len:275 (-),score=40.25 TRINITY_DN28607_c1_g1_i1:116-940(-)
MALALMPPTRAPSPLPAQRQWSLSVAHPALMLSDLSGVWSTDCGLMTVHDAQVCDANGDVASLSIAATGGLELRFGGELWRSVRADRDHIVWERDGGVWCRAGNSWTTAPSVPAWRDDALSNLRDPVVAAGSPVFLSRLPNSVAPATQAARCAFPSPPPPALLTPPTLGHRPPSAGALLVPPSAQMLPAASQNLPLLEAKLDHLANAVLDLHGEMQRQMHQRRAFAQRRALQDIKAAAAGVVASPAEPTLAGGFNAGPRHCNAFGPCYGKSQLG